MTKLQSKEDYSKLLERYDNFLFDCDGVLWNGDRITPGAIEVLSYLRSQKKKVVFVTNNASKSRKDYKKKLDKLGVQGEVEEIFSSAYASAVYISQVLKLPKDKKIYVIGMAGLETELAIEGISYLGGTAPEDNTLEPFHLENWTPDKDVVGVLCGLDLSINYTKLSKAFNYLRRDCGEKDENGWGGECKFLATNTDSTYPTGGGLLPGAGSLSAVLRFSTGRDPVSIGKPGPTMMDCIKEYYHFDPERTIMIGDRLDTDIAFGKNGGVSTLLVLTGVTSEASLAASTTGVVPDYILGSVGDLQILC